MNKRPSLFYRSALQRGGFSMSIPFRVTDRAWKRLCFLVQHQSIPYLKLVARQGGCSGTTTRLIPCDDDSNPNDVWIEAPETHRKLITSSRFLCIDGTSVFRLFGHTMDVIETPTDTRFTFYRSDGQPNRTCGCGESF